MTLKKCQFDDLDRKFIWRLLKVNYRVLIYFPCSPELHVPGV